jgi:death on curing protein
VTWTLELADALAVIDHLGFTVADVGLLASAVGRPAATVLGVDAYPDLPTKAAALLDSVARNHALADGNKRTAWVLTRVLLLANGYQLIADEQEAEDFIVAVATGAVTVKESAAWLAARMTST